MTAFLRLLIPCLVIAPIPSMAEDAVDDATGTRLPGHRAVYELSLGKADATAAITGAEGLYVLDLEDVCEGYTLNERLVVRLSRDDGTMLTDYRLSAYETESGDLYRFSTETEFNGTTGQSASGNLSVREEHAEVQYDSNDDLSFDEEVLPPLAHIRAMIGAARAGDTRYAATVFDGDPEKPVFHAVTRITPAEGGAVPDDLDGSEYLDGHRYWHIDSVYFPPSIGNDPANSVPEFRFTAHLYDNGVVTDLVLDYLDFSLVAELAELKVHDDGC